MQFFFINNNNQSEFKDSINIICELYKKIEESDKKNAKDRLCSFIDSLPDIERQIKIVGILRDIFLENKLLNESFEFGIIICDKVLTNKKYNEYNKLLKTIIDDIEIYKDNNIARRIRIKLSEIEKQIEEENKKNNENIENSYEENYEDNYKKNHDINNNINDEIEIQEDIYKKYNNDNVEYFDRIENMFKFNNKFFFTDIVSNKMKYFNNNSPIKENILNILIITENDLIANKILKVFSKNNFVTHKAKMNNLKYNYFSFQGKFKGIKSNFKLYLIQGHLYKTELGNNNNNTYIKTRISDNSKEIEKRIRYLSQGIDILLLGMNNDSEGENISYEVIYNALPFMNKKNFNKYIG